MSKENLPRQQERALAKMTYFAAGISADPAGYGLAPGDAAALQAAVDDFAAAFAAGNPQANRTRVDVAAKGDAFGVAEIQFRRCYSLVKWNDAIPDADKVAIDVRPVNRKRSPVELADTVPLLMITAAKVLGHVLSYADSATPASKRKPRGATQLQLFVAVGDAAVHDPAAARLIGCYTRSPLTVTFDRRDEGKRATYFGRWVSQRGKFGRFSAPAGMRIAG